MNLRSFSGVMAAIALMLTVSFSAQAQLGGAVNRARNAVQSASGTAKEEEKTAPAVQQQNAVPEVQQQNAAPAVQQNAASLTDQTVYPTDSDEGVVINGVKWATRNVGEPGKFTANPSEAGMFYQWNRKVAYNVTDIDIRSGWDKSLPAGNTWEKSNSPCPAGWRLPTLEEIQTLLDYDKVERDWTTLNGVKGRRLTDKATGNSIFIPAAGGRNELGTLIHENRNGYCWSSTVSGANYARYLSAHGGTVETGTKSRIYAMSIRAVAE